MKRINLTIEMKRRVASEQYDRHANKPAFEVTNTWQNSHPSGSHVRDTQILADEGTIVLKDGYEKNGGNVEPKQDLKRFTKPGSTIWNAVLRDILEDQGDWYPERTNIERLGGIAQGIGKRFWAANEASDYQGAAGEEHDQVDNENNFANGEQAMEFMRTFRGQ